MTLKEAIDAKHREAEKMPFNQRMFKGELTPKEYLQYLNEQYSIFSALEAGGLPHPSLSRTTAVLEDMNELRGEVEGELIPILESTAKYVEHINGLSNEDKLPHIYLNYLALMFGGQMMKAKVPGSGKLYDFDNQMEAAGSIRAIQKDEWADEANRGLDFMIGIFDELQRLS